MLKSFALKIKRQENGFYTLLYKTTKSILSFHFPLIRVIHLPLYHLQSAVSHIVRRIVQSTWTIPVFMARCEKCGKGLKLPNGMPLIVGSHLQIFLGDNVTIRRSTIGSAKVFDMPKISIGNNSSVGYGTSISVASEVIIGNDTMISVQCMIMDNADHPINPADRLARKPVNRDEVQPVHIGNNVWIGAYSVILKGVSIGDNSIVSTHSVVTKDVPANCIVGGVPARLIKRDI